MKNIMLGMLLILTLLLNISSVTAAAEEERETGVSSEMIEIKVSVIWDDDDSRDGIRPDRVSVQLYANEEPFGEATTLTEANSWSCSWELQKYDANNTEIQYTVDEIDVPEGYSKKITGDAVSGFTITNCHEPETMNVDVSIAWDDSDNKNGVRPDSVILNLLANGLEIAEQVVKETDGWQCSFDDLPVYDDGEEIAYVVGEEMVDGYRTAITGAAESGFVVTNNRLATTAVTVKKVWDDAGNWDGIRPDSVMVQLYANDEVSGAPVMLDASNGWSCTWTELAMEEGGVTIVYTVDEINVPEGYTKTVSGNASKGYTITNTRAPKTYTVFYDLAGGSSTTEKLTYDGLKSGEATPSIADPTMEEWTFTGWEPTVVDTVTADVTYTAQWVQNGPLIRTVLLEKEVDRVRASVGDDLTYTISVTNTGNVPLEYLMVIDEMLGKTETIAKLEVSETMTFTYVYTVAFCDSGKTLVNTTIALKDGKVIGEDACTTWIDDWYEPQYVQPVAPQLNREDHYAYIIGKDDGLIHPLDPITRAETATIFFRMLKEESRQDYWTQENDYLDVDANDWFNNAVSTLTNAGIFTGRPENLFDPDANITRGEFAALAVRFFLKDDVEIAENDLTDVKGHWAEANINLAYARGLITGYPDGTFRPDQEITRAEAMVIINRVLERFPDEEHLLSNMITWPDNMDTNVWYYADVQEATNSHIYVMMTDKNGEEYENWLQLLEVRDWAALEKTWSEYNTSKNPGEIVDTSMKFDH